jgi:hypothetical protein
VSARLCPECFAGTPPEDAACWLCGAALPPFGERVAPAAVGPAPPFAGAAREDDEPPSRTLVPDLAIWLAGVLLTLALMGAAIVELSLSSAAPGALAGAACAPAIVALSAMLWARRHRRPGPGEEGSGRAPGVVSLPRGRVRAVLALVALALAAVLAGLVASLASGG